MLAFLNVVGKSTQKLSSKKENYFESASIGHAADAASDFDSWLRPALKSPLYHGRELHSHFRLFRNFLLQHEKNPSAL